VNGPGLDAIKALGVIPDIHLYVRSGDEFDLRTRMFAPYDGVPEDPATGSANCALAALLTQERKESAGAFKYRIAQGVEMGRPSVLEARSEKRDGAVSGTWIGGASVLVSEGTIEVGG
jgi:trans-2,3-dihydro-3-hydroxyanthranilate isomerase